MNDNPETDWVRNSITFRILVLGEKEKESFDILNETRIVNISLTPRPNYFECRQSKC